MEAEWWVAMWTEESAIGGAESDARTLVLMRRAEDALECLVSAIRAPTHPQSSPHDGDGSTASA